MGAGIANATITGKSGNNQSLTATPIRNIYLIEWNIPQKLLKYWYRDSAGNPFYLELDYSGITTFTVTISGDTSTIVQS